MWYGGRRVCGIDGRSWVSAYDFLLQRGYYQPVTKWTLERRKGLAAAALLLRAKEKKKKKSLDRRFADNMNGGTASWQDAGR